MQNLNGKISKKIIMLIVIINFGILLIGVSSYILIKRNATSYLTINDIFSGNSIYYNDGYYSLKENITTYLLMGIDNDGGQADTLILAVADNDNKELFLIPINRNIMADIKVFNDKGEYFGFKNRQICLAHSVVYGFYDPEIATVEAVSNLLFGVPIDYYVSLDMAGIEYLSAAVGDVEVVVNETVLGSSLIEGETVVINSENVFEYLRVRDNLEIGGAEKRLVRQVNFLLGSYNKFKNPVKAISIMKDNFLSPDLASDFDSKYKLIQNYIKTNIDNSVSVAIKYLSYELSLDNVYYIPHKTQLDGEGIYEVCYIHEEKAKEILLKVFYNKTLF